MSTTTKILKTPKPSKEVQQLAREAFLENRKMNAAKAVYEKDRKALFLLMKEEKISSFSIDGQNEKNEKVLLDVLIDTPTGQAVDIEKLFKLVSKEQFLKIVTATQKAVTDIVGGSILKQVLVDTKGTENVSIAARK